MTTFKDLYFSTMEETENAVLDFIARGVKFLAVGITHLLVEVEDEETPAITETPQTPEETAKEETPTAHLLDIYVNNESEIYYKYTVPAIDKVAAMIRSNQGSSKGGNFDITAAAVAEFVLVRKAVSKAAGIVYRFDGLTPTQQEKKAAALNLAAYVIEMAEYQVKAA